MPACPLVDCHTHTSFSDGHASFEDNVRAAAAANCRVMVSTDHLTLPASMDANCEVQVTEGDLPAHRLGILRMLASLPRRLRRSSALSMALNAIGTRAASLWLIVGPRRRRAPGQCALDWQPRRYCGRRCGHGGDGGRRSSRYARFELRLDRRRHQPACLGKLGRARRMGALCRRLVPRLRKPT